MRSLQGVLNPFTTRLPGDTMAGSIPLAHRAQPHYGVKLMMDGSSLACFIAFIQYFFPILAASL